MVSTYEYICTAVCICLYTRHIFYLGTCAFVHGFIVVYAYMGDYSGMYVELCNICTVIANNKGKDRPGKVANPARGQFAEQGK